MNPLEGVRLALGQIRAQKLKSFFSVLGVIIGVMFLITVVSVVEGIDRYIREDFSSRVYGINTLTLRRFPQVQITGNSELRRQWYRRPRLTYDDADAIRERMTVPGVVAVESGRSGEVEAEDTGRKVENVRLIGASAEFFRVRRLEIEDGRLFSGEEARRGLPVAVLGSSTAETLFPELEPLGRTVRIRGFPYRVIGVLEEEGSLLGISLDNLTIAPATSHIRHWVNPPGVVDEILVQVPDPTLIRPAQHEVEAIMRSRRGLRPTEGNDFVVETADESLSFWDRISRVLFIALPGLVAISLVVGGIVIMNIMLVSVMERTREIGVRKALGARRRDILVQVLIESATLSGTGAAFGVAVGVGLTYVIRAVSPLPATVTPGWVSLGVIVGVLVGVIAGVYPAARASRLDPVDALRYE